MSFVVIGFSISFFFTTHFMQLSHSLLVSLPQLPFTFFVSAPQVFSSLLQQLFTFFVGQHFVSPFVSCSAEQTQLMHSDANVVAQNTTSASIDTAFEKVRYLNFILFTDTKIQIFSPNCQLGSYLKNKKNFNMIQKQIVKFSVNSLKQSHPVLLKPPVRFLVIRIYLRYLLPECLRVIHFFQMN